MTDEQLPKTTESYRPDPWDQQEGETDRDYARFLTYLTLRDRRQSRAALQLGLSEQGLKQIRARWRWVNRAAAHDQAQAEQVLASTARLRNEAAASLLEGILGSADALKEVPDEERDARALQSLASAVRSLTPVTEVTVSSSGEAAPDVVEVAFRRAQQMRRESDENG